MTNSVVYVEDEEDYQMLVRRILGKAGLEIHLASTGQEGLALIQRIQPRLVILDVNLPDTDGYSFCRQLRQRPEGIQPTVLMLTVKRRPEEWLNGFASGADDYMAKPLNPPELVSRARYCLNYNRKEESAGLAPEHLLIQAAISGNRTAFEVLLRQYRGRLIDSFHASGKTWTDAEDIAAVAFGRAYERLHQFRGESSFYTWLYRIALNESFRSRWRHGSVFAAPVTEALEANAEDAESSQRMLYAQVKQAVSYVPKPYRQMLRWHFIRGFSYQRIARRLRIPPGTVMSRLFEAKRLLRQSWRRIPPP